MKEATPAATRGIGLIVVLSLMSVSGGCGGGGAKVTEVQKDLRGSALTNLGAMYAEYQMNTGKPPQNHQILNEMPGAPPGGLMGAEPESVTVYWGVPMPDPGSVGAPSTPSDKVLAYDNQVPTTGGYVLMLDGRVVKMTAEEFKAAPKAGPEPAAASK